MRLTVQICEGNVTLIFAWQLYEVMKQSWQRTHMIFLALELLGGGDLFKRMNEEPLSERYKK
jgi:hypothetical protein